MRAAKGEFFAVAEAGGEGAWEEGARTGRVGADGVKNGQEARECQQRSAPGDGVDDAGGERGRGKEKPAPERITHANSKGNRAEAPQQFS